MSCGITSLLLTPLKKKKKKPLLSCILKPILGGQYYS